MFTNEKIAVHSVLEELHKQAECRIQCCGNGCNDNQCISYCGCGALTEGENEGCLFPCENRLPCKHCLIWSGYGHDDIKKLKSLLVVTKAPKTIKDS